MSTRRGMSKEILDRRRKEGGMRADVTDTGHCICLLFEHQNPDSSFFPMPFPLLFNPCRYS
jgi:hypothetical protein